MPRRFFVYILASDTRELYVGITNNLIRRLAEHRAGADPYRYVFRHQTTRLVHVEEARDARDASRRQQQLKEWTRRSKLELIGRGNPEWKDLAAEWSNG